jgi:hypothetical protein
MEDGAAAASHLPIICSIFLSPHSHPGLVRRCPSLTPSTHSATTTQHAFRATYPCNTDSSIRRGLLSTVTAANVRLKYAVCNACARIQGHQTPRPRPYPSIPYSFLFPVSLAPLYCLPHSPSPAPSLAHHLAQPSNTLRDTRRATLSQAQYTAPFPDIRPALWPRLSFSGLRVRRLRHTSRKTQCRPTTARPRYSHLSRLPIRLVCARVGHVCPTLLPFLSSLHVLKPSSSPCLPLPFSISTLTCSCPPLVTKPPRNHLPSRKLPVPRRTSGCTALLCCSHRRARYPAGAPPGSDVVSNPTPRARALRSFRPSASPLLYSTLHAPAVEERDARRVGSLIGSVIR